MNFEAPSVRLPRVTEQSCTHIEWQCEVGVEAGEEDEERRDEVVDGGSARVRRQRDRNQVDDGHDGPTQILKQ